MSLASRAYNTLFVKGYAKVDPCHCLLSFFKTLLLYSQMTQGSYWEF